MVLRQHGGGQIEADARRGAALLTTLTCKRRQFDYWVVVKWTRQLARRALRMRNSLRQTDRPIAAAAAAAAMLTADTVIGIYAQRAADRADRQQGNTKLRQFTAYSKQRTGTTDATDSVSDSTVLYR